MESDGTVSRPATGLAVVTDSQWAGWTEDGKRNAADPGPATVGLVKLAPR